MFNLFGKKAYKIKDINSKDIKIKMKAKDELFRELRYWGKHSNSQERIDTPRLLCEFINDIFKEA